MELLPYSNQVLFTTDIPLIGFRQLQSFSFPFPVDSLVAPREKPKVIFVLGSTGTGKSKLAVDLATHFDGEIVNSDKIQIYAGLDIITNKVTKDECAGIPHHLIGRVPPYAKFAASDFRIEATRAVESVVACGRLPIVAGGSNSYIEELVNGDSGKFRCRYDCCFIWVDVDLAVLDSFVSVRVDKMVEMGLVEEARGMYNPEGDYSSGIRKAIGVPEMDRYFRAEPSANEATKATLLEAALDEIKANTRRLARRQLQKIQRLSTLVGWNVLRVDATSPFLLKGRASQDEWERTVRAPSLEIVRRFLHNENGNNGTVSIAANDCFMTNAAGGDAGDAAIDNYCLATTTACCGSATAGAAAASVGSAAFAGATR